jgi:hypothetical protein
MNSAQMSISTSASLSHPLCLPQRSVNCLWVVPRCRCEVTATYKEMPIVMLRLLHNYCLSRLDCEVNCEQTVVMEGGVELIKGECGRATPAQLAATSNSRLFAGEFCCAFANAVCVRCAYGGARHGHVVFSRHDLHFRTFFAL